MARLERRQAEADCRDKKELRHSLPHTDNLFNIIDMVPALV